MQGLLKLGRSERLFRCSIWDVVILPAFGASVQEMQLLKDKGCTIVDTTCPWVSKVWNTVEKHKKAIIPQLFTASTITKKQLLQVRLLLSIW